MSKEINFDREMHEKMLKNEEMIKKLNEQQDILLKASSDLINAKVYNFQSVINTTMEYVAKIAVADRVYVFEYDLEKKVANNIFEWCNEGITPQLDILQNVPIPEMIEWYESHKNNEIITINDVSKLPEDDSVRKILEPQEIQSLLSVPLFTEGKLYGFIGFDSVKIKHTYTHEEKELIQQYGNSLMSTLTRIKYNSELATSKEQLAVEKELFKTTLLSVGDGVISTDSDGKIIIMNFVAQNLTGWSVENAVGQPVENVFHIIEENTMKRFENPVKKVIKTGKSVEPANNPILIGSDNSKKIIELSASPIKDSRENLTGVVLVFRDFTEKKKRQDEIQYLSYHDYLTGLYNRRFFEKELERLDKESNLPITIIMGDVNGLKLINDSFGHYLGDELLVKAAKTIKKCLRESDLIARVGGDEFSVILPGTNSYEAEKIIKRIKHLLQKQKIRDLDISISFGFEVKKSPDEPITTIFKKAEDYMYTNKLFEGPSVRNSVIDNIIETINNKSPREKIHSQRVSELCAAIGSALKLEDQEINKLRVFGLVHDIGKIAISDEILNKTNSLTEIEEKDMRRHVEIGYRILNTATDMLEISECVLCHHERFDGKGYPKGLSGEDIPLFSRICSVADAFDAMTTKRTYRSAMSIDHATKELKGNSGTQFDANIVEVFLNEVLPDFSTTITS